MQFLRSPTLAISLGAFVCVMLALLGARLTTPGLITPVVQQAPAVIAEAGGGSRVKARFVSAMGLPTRHPELTGGEQLENPVRANIARAIAELPGVGGVSWSDGDMLAEADTPILNPMHCQEDVAALLRARTIRFEESSARIDAASRGLIGEVAAALSPCLGAIIAITGHTDSTGPEPDNIALSRERAAAVRTALIERGIPEDGLRIAGMGSARPIEGLPAEDPANRRIEFSVLKTEPIVPTPVDTPSPR
jgi:OOP family OmpA-OmpF porin